MAVEKDYFEQFRNRSNAAPHATDCSYFPSDWMSTHTSLGKKVTMSIHKEFMFWAVGCTDDLTAPTPPDLILTPKAAWKFQNGVLLLSYALLHFCFGFVPLLWLLLIEYLSLVDQQALSLSLSLYLPTPPTNKRSKHSTWSSCHHWDLKRIANSEFINNKQSPVGSFAIAV